MEIVVIAYVVASFQLRYACVVMLAVWMWVVESQAAVAAKTVAFASDASALSA